MATRKAKDKTKVRQKQVASLKRRMAEPRLSCAGIPVDPADVEKMSEVLEEFVRPFLPEKPSENAFRNAVSLAATAWNAAILPDEQMAEVLDRVMGLAEKELAEDNRPRLHRVLLTMVARKRAFFPHNKRFIDRYYVTPTAGGFDLTVLSTAEPVQAVRGN